jgi:SAM-dependent methyltransferase
MKNPYRDTHLIYNHLMRMIDFEGWAEYVRDIIQYYDLNPNNILELASGNGRVSKFLEKHYPQLTLTDISFNMLRQDDSSNYKVVCDMTSIPLRGNYDFIFSTFDSINYLTDSEEVVKMFSEVNEILTKNGLFTFDVSLEKNSIQSEKKLNRSGKMKGIKYKQQSRYDVQSRIHENIFYIHSENKAPIIEKHQQKIYRFAEYFEFVDNSELTVIDCFDFFSFETANEECDRVQFVLARKN